MNPASLKAAFKTRTCRLLSHSEYQAISNLLVFFTGVAGIVCSISLGEGFHKGRPAQESAAATEEKKQIADAVGRAVVVHNSIAVLEAAKDLASPVRIDDNDIKSLRRVAPQLHSAAIVALMHGKHISAEDFRSFSKKINEHLPPLEKTPHLIRQEIPGYQDDCLRSVSAKAGFRPSFSSASEIDLCSQREGGKAFIFGMLSIFSMLGGLALNSYLIHAARKFLATQDAGKAPGPATEASHEQDPATQEEDVAAAIKAAMTLETTVPRKKPLAIKSLDRT